MSDRPEYCGGCGETDPEKRCIGCLADFGPGPTSEGEAAEQSFSDDELDKAIDYVGSGYGVDGPEVYSFLKELRDRRSADQTAPQPDQPDLEVVGYVRVHHGKMHIENIPLMEKSFAVCSVTDAHAHIAALTAKVASLETALRHADEISELYREMYVAKSNEKVEEFRRAETAEARVAQLEEALERLVQLYEQDCDPEVIKRPDWMIAALGGQSNG